MDNNVQQNGQDGPIEFRVYEHPLLPQRVVKQGVSWPAFFVGPFWLLFRKLWMPAIFLAAIVGIAHHFNHNNISDDPLMFWSCMKADGRWYHASHDVDCYERTELIDILIILLAHIGCALKGNGWWERDLKKRGYKLAQSMFAQSIDDARGKLVTLSSKVASVASQKNDA